MEERQIVFRGLTQENFRDMDKAIQAWGDKHKEKEEDG